MKELWRAWYGAFPPAWCDNVVDRAQARPAQSGTVGSTAGQIVDPTYRSSTIRWLDHTGGELDIANKLHTYIKLANRESFGVDIWDMSSIQFTEYHATATGKYDWHHDVAFTNPEPFDRKLSVIVQLSNPNDYSGGDFEFYNETPSPAFRLQGTIVVFPSFLLHRVTPVTAGIRRSLVSWIDGPKWR